VKFYIKYIFSLFLLYSLTGNTQAQGQNDKPKDGSIVAFNIGLGVASPLGDLSQRYGRYLNFGLDGEYITASNLIFSGQFIYYFSDNVQQDVLAPFRTPQGYLLGDDAQTADVLLRARALFAGVGIGKLFPTSRVSRSGIKASLHFGILQHNIRFVDERNSLGQIRAGRSVGYDRLHRGFALKETVSYKHLSADRRLNFELCLDFTQGFTSSVRKINFDTGLEPVKSKMDLIVGLRLMWTIPFYNNGESDVYY